VIVLTMIPIGGHDAIDEFMASRIWLLCAGLDFGEVEALTLISKVVVPLPKFVAAKHDGETDEQFVAKVAEQADKLIGRYTWKEH
jgi:hypothetical protein